MTAKHRFWLFNRRGVFYVQDALTGQQESLHTRDRREAERLRQTKNDALAQPFLSLAIGKAYLAAHDPSLVKRVWNEVMTAFTERGQPHTRKRRERRHAQPPLPAFAREAFD